MERYRSHITATLFLGLPLIGSHLARMAIQVADTVMMGWYGVEELAALIIAGSFFITLFFLGMGFGTAVMGLIATAIARDQEQEVRRSTRMALWLSALFSLAVMPSMWFSEPILIALGQKAETAALAQQYLRIAGWGMLPMLCGLTLNSYLAALERPNIIMLITLAGLPVNVFLNWVLIFGQLGAPELGVRGAAIATLFTLCLQLVIQIAYCEWLPQARKFHLFQRFWRPDWQAFFAVARLGLPIGLTMLAEGGLFVGSNVMVGWIGTEELAAHGIALQIASITFMAHLGLSNAATVRIGQAKGRGDAVWMRDAAVTVTVLSMLVAVIAIAVYLLFPQQLVSLYLDPGDPQAPNIIAIGTMLLFYAALFQLADALQVIALGLLRGVHDTRVPMWIAAFSYWIVGMPVAYGLAFIAGMGAPGLWLGLVVGLVCAAALLLLRFWRGHAKGDWTRPVPAV